MGSGMTFEVVARDGVRVRETGLDRVVLRRREPDHDPGSEVAILPHHGALLMQAAVGEVRLVRGDAERAVSVPRGVVEVRDDTVTYVVT